MILRVVLLCHFLALDIGVAYCHIYQQFVQVQSPLFIFSSISLAALTPHTRVHCAPYIFFILS